MRAWITLLLLLLVPASAVAEPERPAILVLGDSLSAAYDMPREQGWPALLEDRLDAAGFPHRVVNASASGETSAGGASRLPELLTRHEPAVVIIALGGNDGLRALPPEQLADNLRAMLAETREAGAEPVLAGVHLPPNYGRHYLDRFDEVFPAVAAEYDAALVPRILDGIGERRELMQADGIHPHPDAQPKILENIWSVLAPLLEGSADITRQ